MLYKSRHTELEKLVLAADYLSQITNPIEKESLLGLYAGTEPKDVTASITARWRSHRLLLRPQNIDQDEDKRIAARLIDQKAAQFALRGRHLHWFTWDEVPGPGEERIRRFLVEDFEKECFAHLVFESIEEILETQIEKGEDDSCILVTSSHTSLVIKCLNRTALLTVEGTEHRVHEFLLVKKDGRTHVYINDNWNVIAANRKLVFLLQPLIFERQPIYRDAYLLYKASTTLARRSLVAKEVSHAADYATYAREVARRMRHWDSKEQDYIRWEGLSRRLLASAEMAEGLPASAVEDLRKDLELFRALYNRLPNISRLIDLCKALENGIANMADHVSDDEVHTLTDELQRLRQQKTKVEHFVNRAGIVIGGLGMDLLEEMADHLDFSDKSGLRNGEAYGINVVRANTVLDRATWEQFNEVLVTHGFAWTKLLQSEHVESYWEKSTK